VQFLAAWLAVWLGRVLQEQVDFLRAENRLLREGSAWSRRAPGKWSAAIGLVEFSASTTVRPLELGMHDGRSGGDRVSAHNRMAPMMPNAITSRRPIFT
jgi:hypothetical protein